MRYMGGLASPVLISTLMALSRLEIADSRSNHVADHRRDLSQDRESYGGPRSSSHALISGSQLPAIYCCYYGGHNTQSRANLCSISVYPQLLDKG
jgi:hypothetical protein